MPNKQPKYYMQTDPAYGSFPYCLPGENTNLAKSGCGPTSAAMLIATLADKNFTPIDACKWSLDHGGKALHQGTYYSYFVKQFAAFGLSCKQLNNASIYGQANSDIHEQAFKLVKEGWYLIACMGKGTWTSSGHYVVVWWVDDVIYINDPASQKTYRLRGDPYTFRSQVKYYWAIDARAYNNAEPAQPEQPKEEEDEMATTVQKIMEMTGLSEDEVVHRLAVDVKFTNPTTEQWETDGVKSLKDSGIINTDRDPRQPVTFGEFGVIAGRMMEKK